MVIKKAIKDNKASSGSVILVDAPQGEILAIANHPTYDNNETFSSSWIDLIERPKRVEIR